jgi:pentatricopeptide repeat protein
MATKQPHNQEEESSSSDRKQPSIRKEAPVSVSDSNNPKPKPKHKIWNRNKNPTDKNKPRNYSKPKTPYKEKPPTGLNNELFRLRQRRNGITLAERRLEAAVDLLLQDVGGAKQALEANDTKAMLLFPDEVSFNAIISSHSKNAHRDWMAPQKSERLLRRMQELAVTFPHLQPSIFTFNAVLEALAKIASSKHPRRAQQSQLAILRLFQELQQQNLTPNTFTNNLVLTSNARFSPEWQSLETWALNYLDGQDTSLQPDRQTYNQLLKGYAEIGNADKAEKLLHKIIQATTSGSIDNKDAIKANPVWFNLVLKALARGQRLGQRSSNTGDRADQLLSQMYSLHKDGYSNRVHPDSSTYNHVLNVHALIGNTRRAEALVEELEQAFLTKPDYLDLSPDKITFTTLIKTYATKQRIVPGSSIVSAEIATNATRVFERMQSLSKVGRANLAPSVVTCTFVRSSV